MCSDSQLKIYCPKALMRWIKHLFFHSIAPNSVHLFHFILITLPSTPPPHFQAAFIKVAFIIFTVAVRSAFSYMWSEPNPNWLKPKVNVSSHVTGKTRIARDSSTAGSRDSNILGLSLLFSCLWEKTLFSVKLTLQGRGHVSYRLEQTSPQFTIENEGTLSSDLMEGLWLATFESCVYPWTNHKVQGHKAFWLHH